MSRTFLKAAAITGIAAFMAASAAHAASPVKAGSMACTVDDTNKSLFKTHVVMSCSYTDVNGNNAGDYEATISRTGLKLGTQKTTDIRWVVLTLGDPQNVTLDGTYVGGTAGASVGAGAGVNYLTGGFEGKISLQPWSAEGKTGIGFDISGQKMKVKSVPGS